MKIGIFFGGRSREREVSFVGGRTVYDNIDKGLFSPIPIFLDSIGNFILLDWKYLYNGTIRDFYPKQYHNDFKIYIESYKDLDENFINQNINRIGKKIYPYQFFNLFDFAFLTLHGQYGEDGTIQGILEYYNIPYLGSGIYSSALSVDKALQRRNAQLKKYNDNPYTILTKKEWDIKNMDLSKQKKIFENVKQRLSLPIVVKASKQGSSQGVAVLKNDSTFTEFKKIVDKCFFRVRIDIKKWINKSPIEKIKFINLNILDIRTGIGMPVFILDEYYNTKFDIIYNPEILIKSLNFIALNDFKDYIYIESYHQDNELIIEKYIDGIEFSTIVLQSEDSDVLALPPTQLSHNNQIFDYRAKYLPGIASKLTPIDLSTDKINQIRKKSEKMFIDLNCCTFARIDGFIDKNDKIFLNDPNTTVGLNPSSFLFHQSAEIGLSPTDLITFLIKSSLKNAIHNRVPKPSNFKRYHDFISKIKINSTLKYKKKKVGVLMGGFTHERHISIESSRNIFNKLTSSSKYTPIPIFLTGNPQKHKLFIIPINILLKDNADDIHQYLNKIQKNNHDILTQIRKQAKSFNISSGKNIYQLKQIEYEDLPKIIDYMFIGLHGRPGEDGHIQKILSNFNIPYNGSGPESSSITIDKYKTNQLLKKNGINISPQLLVHKKDWESNQNNIISSINQIPKYPLIAKPHNEGCSAEVKCIKNEKELINHLNYFLSENDMILLETFVQGDSNTKIFELTVGLLTKFKKGTKVYQIFQPSQSIAIKKILSLEEKFLAGEGQNITPPNFVDDEKCNDLITKIIKEKVKEVAKILNVEGYARIDLFLKIQKQFLKDSNFRKVSDTLENIKILIIEVNSLPAMTPATCIFQQCVLAGYTPLGFIESIIEYGYKRFQKMYKKI